MKWRLTAGVVAAMLAAPLWALDEIHGMAGLDRLAAKAKEAVDVTLDTSMLQLASGFLSPNDPDQARVKKLVAKLKGVYVRSFEFDRDGEYSPSDVEGIRASVKGPGWTRIVGVKEMKGGEDSEVYLKKDGNQLAGIVVIVAEPKELTVVDIDGPIDPQELSELGGHMGIPKFGKSQGKPEKGAGKGDQ
ncbi:MAG: DUF4252 domain-containing protein [Acidobacteriaceae bacterium]|nr:DUF4252 domain-containing protein [Acidobacteriaceae bacterium]